MSLAAVAMVCIAAPTAVAASDPALLQQLETAATVHEYAAAVNAVNERLDRGPLDPAHSDQVLTALAAGLAGEKVLPHYLSSAISATLHKAGRPLPDTAFDALLAALEHRAMLNRLGAIEVLATLAVDDRRRPRTIDALASVVADHEHEHTRSAAAKALSSLGLDAPLPEPAIAALIGAALTDDYVTVRIDAADAVSHQVLQRQQAIAVTESLAAELIDPTEVTRRARGIHSFGSYGGRAGELLARMYDPPYPAHVIDLWISQLKSAGYEAALDLLGPAILRGEFSTAQREALLTAARSASMADQSLDIYAAAFAGSTPADVARAVQMMNSTATPEEQLAAAHRILAYYESDAVPENIAAIAAARLEGHVDAGLHQVLMRLILNSADNATRQDRLVAGLIAHSDKHKAYPNILPLLPLASLEQLVLQTAADHTREFRYIVLSEFAKRANDTAPLSREMKEKLQEVATTSADYLVSQSAGRALDAWGGSVPLPVKLANRQNQTSALGYGLLSLLVVNGLAGIVGFYSLLFMPLQSATGTSTALKRTGLVIGWGLLSVVMLLVLAFAFLGFLGHTSAPPPSWTLSLNVPLYVVTPVYLLLAWLAFRRVQRASSTTRSGRKSPVSNSPG